MTERRLSRRALLAGFGAAASAVAGCTEPAKSPTTRQSTAERGEREAPEFSLSGDDAWTTYGYEPGHTGYNPDATAVGPGSRGSWASTRSGSRRWPTAGCSS